MPVLRVEYVDLLARAGADAQDQASRLAVHADDARTRRQGEIRRKLRRRLLAFLVRRVDDRAIAEDILQAAYVRALESKERLRADESVVAWFYRILRNAVIDYYRRRATEGAALDRWAQELELATAPEPQLEEMACECIAGALDVIAPAYADLVREVDLKEKGLATYAEANGITVGNAAVRAHRARAALRRQLIRCCGTCAEHGCLECRCRVGAVTI